MQEPVTREAQLCRRRRRMAEIISRVQFFRRNTIPAECMRCPYARKFKMPDGYPTSFCVSTGKKVNTECPVYEGVFWRWMER